MESLPEQDEAFFEAMIAPPFTGPNSGTAETFRLRRPRLRSPD